MSEYDLSSISDGVKYLQDGYFEYAQEVITERALPNGYDGLKPVNRRILYWLKTEKSDRLRKSADIVGGTMGKYHPHGDSSIYQALVLMTDSNKSYAFPLLNGHGSFSDVRTDDEAAAMRYTEARLHPYASEFFGEMNGITMTPNFDVTTSEPTVLPASFPNVLVNSTSGIAVGFSSDIPSFNFNDVCDLVKEYIQNGECTTVIAPDFVTGGYYIKNDKELLKLMKTGKAKLKLRASVHADGKKLVCTEIPFGRTIQKLVGQINDLNAQSISNAYDTDDYEHDECFAINCTAKSRVDEARYAIFKDTDMQYSYSANMTMIFDGMPLTIGVWGVIERWVKWRREVLRTEYTKQLEDVRRSNEEALAFMNIVNDHDKRMEFVRIVAEDGRAAGRKYIEENFTREEVPADLIDFCSSRSLPSYHDGGKYLQIYNNAGAQIKELTDMLNDIDSVIIKQMDRLKSKYGVSLQRRTEVTTKDYAFIEDESSNEKLVDTSLCTYEVKDGFLRKVRYMTGEDVDWRIDGTASDTLIAFDNRGRLLRIYGQDIPYSGDMSTWLPSYFGFEESDDYRITYVGAMTGEELMLIYRDGNVGFVNTSDWIGNNRNVKVLAKGISVASAPYLGAVVPVSEIGDMLFAMDIEGRVAWYYTKDIKHKDRTARTRVFELIHDNPLYSYSCKSAVEGSILINNIGNYKGKLKFLENSDDYRGDETDFIVLA